MYAVIQTGGKQYKVAPGDTLVVDKLAGEPGTPVDLDEVLLVSREGDGAVAIGQPTVAGALVKGEIVSHGRDKKVIVYKFRRRKNYVRKNGHRQDYTELKINEIVAP
ncbi:MAG TPA: 50S ribosomal protein L21 [Kofleriaceae bacterium]|nr:50S ribosomal protein L21 [Kofleriaceae bacterium]